MPKAKKEEIEAELNLLKVEEVLQERLLKDKRNGEKRLQELDIQTDKLNEEIEEYQESIRNTERIISEEMTNQLEWNDAMNQIDEDLAKLSKYFQADEVKIKDLNLKLVKLREKVKVARNELKNASTRSRMAQLALDKNAEEFREAHKTRQEVVKQWESAIELLGKRDAEIEVAANEVERVKNIVERKHIDLQEQMNFHNNELGNNAELKKKIKDSEKKAQTLKERLLLAEEEKKNYENEVTLERRQILKLSCEIDKNRTKLNKMKKDKINNIKKLNALNVQCSELQNRKTISTGLVLTAEEKVQEIENILEVYEKQHDQLKVDLDKQKTRRLAFEKELRDLENEKEIAELEVKSMYKEQTKIKNSIVELKEILQKKEDILYNNEFELAKIERHNAKATGKCPDENRAHLKEELSILKTKLDEQHNAKRSIDNLIYKLEVHINRCRKEIDLIDEMNDKKQEDINETELVIETSARQASALKQEIHELTVEDKMLSMTEIKIKDEVKLIEKEILEIEKAMIEDDAIGKDKLSSLTSAKDMYDGQIRCIQAEIDDLNHQIQIRESRKEKLKIKHETIFKSLGKMEDENGEKIPSHAYYLVKLAQEKAELKDQSETLTKKIKKEESEIKGLKKALNMMKSSNTDFRTFNLRKKSSEDSELTELKEEEKLKKEFVKDLRKKLSLSDNEITTLEKVVLQLDMDLENLKCIFEEKQETLRTLKHAVMEQDRKMERAKAFVDKARAEFKESSPASATDFEIDMNIKIQKEKQKSALIKLRDLCAFDEEFAYALEDTVRTLNMNIPEISRLEVTPTSGRRSSISSARSGQRNLSSARPLDNQRKPSSSGSRKGSAGAQQWQMSFEPPAV